MRVKTPRNIWPSVYFWWPALIARPRYTNSIALAWEQWMADVMQVNSIRFHICLYFLTLSIFHSSSFFSLFLLKIHSLHMIATGFPLCFCCPLKVERNLRRFARPRQKLQKSSSATSDLVQWTARYGLLILMERNFITDSKLWLNPIVATPAPLCSILAPLCTRLRVRLWCKSVNEPRPRSEKAIGGNALVLCKRAHCASTVCKHCQLSRGI